MSLLEVIRGIINKKESTNVFPTYALVLKDIIIPAGSGRESIEEELKHLSAAGLIEIGNTINDRYIKIL